MPSGRMGAVGAHPDATPPSPFAVPWHTAAWAGDPLWANPGNGNEIDVIYNRGTLRSASSTVAKLDPTYGLYVPAPNGQLAGKIAHHSSMNVTDVDFRCRIRLDDYTPATLPRGIVEKRQDNSAGFSWEFAIKTDGKLQTILTTDGTTSKGFDTTAPVSATDGTTIWLRTTIDTDNGASGTTVRTYQAADAEAEPTSWTQIGSDVTISPAVSIYNSTFPMSFGTAGVIGNAAGIGGYMLRAIQYTGIDSGTKIYDVDFRRADTGKFTENGPNGLTVEVRSNADLVSFTATQLPLYVASESTLNDKPAFKGDGTNDRMATLVFPSTLPQPYTLVAIVGAAPTSKLPIDASPSNNWAFYNSAGKWQCAASTVLSEPGTTATDAPHALMFVADGTSSKIYVDGVLKVTGNAGTAAATRLAICGSLSNFPTPAGIGFAGLHSGRLPDHANFAAFKAWVLSEYAMVL